MKRLLKHTPGPWHREEGFVFADRTTQRIADCYCDDQPDMSNARIEANASLIAASPDLLAALKAAIAFIGQTPEYKTGHAGAGSIVTEGNAAIAKAEAA